MVSLTTIYSYITNLIVHVYLSIGETLIAYNIAESLSIGHETLLLCYCRSTYDRFMKLLPYNQHYKASSQNFVKSSSLNNFSFSKKSIFVISLLLACKIFRSFNGPNYIP